MEDLCICKICKKVFADQQGLIKHQICVHSNNNPAFRDKNKDLPYHFRNNNSISITRIQKEPSPNMQSAIMQNQSTFRKLNSAQGGAQPVNIRRTEITGKNAADGRARVPVHSPGVRIATSSIQSKGRIDGSDESGKWQKWKPRENNAADVTCVISSQQAERATSAFCQSTTGLTRQPSTGGRKGVPPLLRVAPSNGKRPAPGMSPTNRASPAGIVGIKTSPHSKIMHNLSKMKSMNAQANNRPSPKVISVPPPFANKKLAHQQQLSKQKPRQTSAQQVRVNQSSQVAKNRILPRSSYNNALPKPRAQQEQRRPQGSADDTDEDEGTTASDEDSTESIPQQKKLLPPKLSPEVHTSKVNFGKAPPQKTLSANRFNPIAPKNNTGNSNSASINRNGSSTSATNAKAAQPSKQSDDESSSALVVAKKSEPPMNKQKAVTLKFLKGYVPKMPGTSYTMPSLTAVGSYTDRNGDDVWECLVCQVKEGEESSRNMICCELCEDWYHWECVGIRATMKEEDPWFCKRCIYGFTTSPIKDFPNITFK